MRVKICTIVLGLLLSGCYRNIKLYPVKGPLAAQTPVPVLKAKLTGAFPPNQITLNPQGLGLSGISVTMPDGETGKGQWKSVRPTKGPDGLTSDEARAC
jgi:hypothetical protein